MRLRVIQPFSLPEVLSTHGYVVYFLTPFLNMVPIMRKERILKKKTNNSSTHAVFKCVLYLLLAKFLTQFKNITIEKTYIFQSVLSVERSRFSD